MIFTEKELFEFLELKYLQYNHLSFIETDPVSIPHQFTLKEDIEISGFLTATISWGKRKSILNAANKLMHLMDLAPYDFILNAGKHDLERLEKFYYRTFNQEDCIYFIRSLQNIYRNHGGLRNLFSAMNETGIKQALGVFRSTFLSPEHPRHAEKHIPDPFAGSSAKRMQLFLRWMVRKDGRGVDFGIWPEISPSQLLIPLDVHSGRVARKLGLLTRKTNDWKAAEELTARLRIFDPEDPVKYDFALFGLGIFEGF